MAKGRIEQEIVVKVVGGKDVADLEQQIKDLIKQKAKVVVDVDADAADAKKKLDAIDQQVADLEKLKAEIEVTADTDDADKKLEEVDQQIADLKKQKAEIEVKVQADTDEADRKLTELDTQLADLRGEKVKLEVEAKVDQALAALDDVAAEARDAKAAADALSTALGPELTAKADLDSIVSDLRNTGLTFKDVTDHADRFGAKLRDIATADPGGSLNDSFRRVSGSIDEIARSADSSKSVLANMVGNATQDLGALGGVAGSIGVAIGQMGEYMVDAANSGDQFVDVLKNFGVVAGPIAGIAAAIQFLSTAVDVYKDAAAASKERTDDLGKAMREAGDDAIGFADVLRGDVDELEHFNTASSELFGEWGVKADALINRIPVIGSAFGDAGDNIIDIAGRAGLSIYELGQIIEDGGEFTGDFKTQLEDARDAGKITSGEFDALSEAMDKYGDSAENAARKAGLFAIDQAEANAMLQEMADQANPLSVFADDFKTIMDDIADGAVDTDAAADAINRVSDALGVPPSEVMKIALGGVADSADRAIQALKTKPIDSATQSYIAQGQAIEDAGEEADRLVEVQGEVADAAKEAAAEWEAMADEISETSFGEAIDQLNSLSELDLAQMRQNTVKSFDDVKDAIKTAAEEVEGWGRMDLTPDSFEELRGMPDQFGAITDAVSGMRETIQTELKAAFATGGIQEFAGKFDFFAGQVREQFTTMFRGMGLPEAQVQAQVNAILADLELLPKDKEIIINLTLAQEGRNALDLFMDEITGLEALNPEVDIKAKIAQGDIAGALAELNALRIAAGRDPIVLPTEVSRVGLERATADAVTAANNYARNHPAVIPSKVNPNPTGAATAHANAQKILNSYSPLIIGARISAGRTVIADSGGTIPPDAVGLVAERRPEIINSRYLVTEPTLVPPGTRVTSGARTARILRTRGPGGFRRYDNGGTVVAGPRTINVNVNAAVVGNRFDVARAVQRANGDIARLMGTR